MLKSKLKLKHKLWLALGILLGLSLFMAGFGYYSLHQMLMYARLRQNLHEARHISQSLLISQKEFLLHEIADNALYESKKSKNLTESLELYKILQENIKTLKISSATQVATIQLHIKQIEAGLTDFIHQYKQLVSLQLKKGFKETGLIGELREKIHQVENNPIQYDKAKMLLLRRHEKDFFLRNDTAYVHKFQKEINNFSQHLANLPIESTKITKLLTQVVAYQQSFLEVVEIDKMIGFQEQEGLKGEIKKEFNKLNTELQSLHKIIIKNSQNANSQIIRTFLIAFSLQLLLAMYLGWRFISRITNRIYQLKSTISALANGELVPPYECKIGDEISQTFEELNLLNQRIETATFFADAIGKGDINKDYAAQYRNGVLETALIKMQSDLHQSEIDKSRNNWALTGLARFAEILNFTESDTKKNCQTVLRELLKHLKAQQGAFFLLQAENETPALEMMACTGYDLASFDFKKTVEIGEGLVGQVFKQNKTLLLTQIPDNYFRTPTGMAELSPTCLLVVPIKNWDTTIGILEVASFEMILPHQVAWVEKIAESLTFRFQKIALNHPATTILGNEIPAIV